jgi:hypothetical protein
MKISCTILTLEFELLDENHNSMGTTKEYVELHSKWDEVCCDTSLHIDTTIRFKAKRAGTAKVVEISGSLPDGSTFTWLQEIDWPQPQLRKNGTLDFHYKLDIPAPLIEATQFIFKTIGI